IHGIVKKYVDSNLGEYEKLADKDFPEIDKILKQIATKIIGILLLPSWKIVFTKWDELILKTKNIKNEEVEVTYYDKE
ncbi:MAG TPA: hypothetical protein DHV18_03070, partial [Brochothrix thermosphacta]|nr:hypothetical protein [Brochothrix thermosphacta]